MINVDETGHFSSEGWCGTQYSDAVTAMDLQVPDSVLDFVPFNTKKNDVMNIVQILLRDVVKAPLKWHNDSFLM